MQTLPEFKLHKKTVLLAVFCLIAAMGLLCHTGFDTSLYADPNLADDLSVQWIYMQRIFNYDKITVLFLAFALFSGYQYCFSHFPPTKRQLLFTGVFSFLFALIQTIGNSFSVSDGWQELTASPLLMLRGILSFIGWINLSFLLVHVLFEGLNRAAAYLEKNKRTAGFEQTPFFENRMRRRIAVLFFCYLPYLILLFPGTNNGDTAHQIAEFFHFYPRQGLRAMTVWGDGGDFMHNHHPFFTTVIYGSFARLGNLLSHGRNITWGIFLYCLLQMLAFVILLCLWWAYLEKEGLDTGICRAGYWGCAFFPGFPLIFICMVKDSLFCLFLLWGTLLLVKLVRSHGAALQKPRFAIAFALCSLLICLSKSQGIYMMILVCILLLLTYRSQWLKVVCCCLLPILFVQLIWLRLLLPAWNVAPGGRQEMLGPLFQQTARYVSLYPDEVTEEEKEIINRIIDYGKLAESYDPSLTDPVKKLYHSQATGDELSAYYKVWLRMFFRHPLVYCDSVVNICYPYFHLSTSHSIYAYTWENDSVTGKRENGLFTHNYFPSVSGLMHILFLGLQKVPLLGLLFSSGFYTWMILLLFVWLLYQKKYARTLPMIYGLLTILVFLIIPASSGRYGWPLELLFPLLLPYILL